MNVHLVFSGPGGDQKVVSLPYSAGKRLKDYLRDPSLRRYGLVHRCTRMRVIDQNHNRVKLSHSVDAEVTLYFRR